MLTFLSLTTLLTEEPPVCVLSKVKVRSTCWALGAGWVPTSGPPGTVASLQGKLCVKTGLGTGVTAGAASAARCAGELWEGESLTILSIKKSLPLPSLLQWGCLWEMPEVS